MNAIGTITRPEYESALRELGLKDEGMPISDTRAGERGEEYYFIYDTEKIRMDKHLRKGDGRDPKYVLVLFRV